MLRVARWRAPSHPPRSEAASSAPSVEELKRNLGRKLSVRFRIHDDPAHPFSEAIGMVQAVDKDASGYSIVQIVNRRGEVTSVRVDDILAAKFWPK